MKKLFWKATLLISAVWIIGAVWIEAMPMAFYNLEYPMWAYQRRLTSSRLDNPPRVLVVGDSRALADILPAELVDPPGAARTLAVGGATPIEATCMLKRYIEHNRPPETVVLSLSPYHLSSCDVFWQRTVKFGFMDLADYLDVLSAGRELDDYPFGDFTTDPLDEPLSRDLMPFEIYKDFALLYLDFLYYYQADLYGGRLFTRLDANRKVMTEMEEGLGRRAVRMTPAPEPLNHEARLDRFDESPLMTRYLHRFLDLCEEHGIRVVYLPAPFNDESYAAMKADYAQGFRNYLSGLGNRYPGSVFVDRIPHYPNRYFGDESHLNEEGARKYTRWIRKNFLSQSAKQAAE